MSGPGDFFELHSFSIMYTLCVVILKCGIDGYGVLGLEGKVLNCSVVNVDLKCSFKIFALSKDTVIASPSGPH